MSSERKFGRIESPKDPQDYDLRDFIPFSARIARDARKWDFPSDSLDQKDTPHCVGFSMASFGINFPTFTLHTDENGHEYYYMCKEKDGEPEAENGTYIRSAAKVLQDLGIIEAYAFAKNLDSMKWWLLNRGPLIAGTLWTEKMMTPKENGTLETGGAYLGGHAYLINEWREDDYIGIQNSWGPEWGDNGKAYIHIDDFLELFMYGGEVLAAVELENRCNESQSFYDELWTKILNFFRDLFA